MSALDTQVGGSHYKDMKIQPMEFSMANGLDACQHSIIKYVSRFRVKGGIADLEKAKHCIDLLIDFEKAKAESVSDVVTENNDGWIKWKGGVNPAGDEYVEYKNRNGSTGEGIAHSLRWYHVYPESSLHLADIIAYRVIDESKEETAKPVEQDGGWITWEGGENPIYGCNVEITLRSKRTMDGPSNALRWSHSGAESDILHYRVIGDAK